jgi:hypothetical protein
MAFTSGPVVIGVARPSGKEPFDQWKALQEQIYIRE